jgi:hypothetical protein
LLGVIPALDSVLLIIDIGSSDSFCVRDVMVNGKPVMSDGRVLTLNQAQILQKAAEYRVKVSSSLK